VRDFGRCLKVCLFELDRGQRKRLIENLVLVPEHGLRQLRASFQQLSDAGKSPIISDNVVKICWSQSVWLEHRVNELLIFSGIEGVVRLENRKSLFRISNLLRSRFNLEVLSCVAQ